MCRFIETICVVDGVPLLLDLHLARVQRTQLFFFGRVSVLDLWGVVVVPVGLGVGRVKCRVVYGAFGVEEVSFVAYVVRGVGSLRLVDGGGVDYGFKFLDRGGLDGLFLGRGGADDVVVVRGGMVTDSYFCNLVFEGWDGVFYTPCDVLLAGVKREFYLGVGRVVERRIGWWEVWDFRRVFLINAMVDLGEVGLDVGGVLGW